MCLQIPNLLERFEVLFFCSFSLQIHDRIIDTVEWGWKRYNPERIDEIADTKVRILNAVIEKKGSNEYNIPRSTVKKKRSLSLVPYASHPSHPSCQFSHSGSSHVHTVCKLVTDWRCNSMRLMWQFPVGIVGLCVRWAVVHGVRSNTMMEMCSKTTLTTVLVLLCIRPCQGMRR